MLILNQQNTKVFFFGGMVMKKILGFAHGVRKEASRIHWPKKELLVKYSVICIVLIAFFGAFFFGLDALFAFLKGVLN